MNTQLDLKVSEALNKSSGVKAPLLGSPIETDPSVGTFVNQVLREQVITEENTDWLINYLMDQVKTPFWFPKSLAKTFLDNMLPGKLLNGLETLINRKKNAVS